MLLLGERDVTRLLPMRDVLGVVREAFYAQAQGALSMPLRTIAASAAGVLGAMPAGMAGPAPALGAKLVTFFAGNAQPVPTHNALIALFDSKTGVPLAVMDGRYITEVRTAATSALATAALARPGSKRVALLGTGVQARAHIRALPHVMTIAELRIWGRTADRASSVAQFARGAGLAAGVADSVREACNDADVICTITSAREPVLHLSHVASGTHVNAVGFGGPSAREISSDLVARARIIVDSLDGAYHESGNIALAIKDGALPEKPSVTLLCDVLAARSAGRRSAGDITLFDSLGIAIEDVACARLVYERACEQRVGTSVDLD